MILKKNYKKSEINMKKIGMVHGVFDVIHIGHIKYFQEAKNHCNYLIASVTADKFVNKSPNKPIFNETQRIELLESLKFFDKVVISNNYTAERNIKKYKPNLYFKGPDYKNLKDISGNLKKEIKCLKSIGGKIYITNNFTYSSSKIINQKFMYLTNEAQEYIKSFDVKNFNKKIKNLKTNKKKILIIGDPILDEYTYVNVSGKANKSSNISTEYISNKIYGGGTILVSNFLNKFFSKISCLISADRINTRLFQNKINREVNLIKLISKYKIIKKNRFIERYNNQKLFQNSINENLKYSLKEKKEIIKYLNNSIKNYDFVLFFDFGYAYSEPEFLKLSKKYKSKFIINCQSNSYNFGFNLATKYTHANILCMDETEFRLCVANKKDNIYELLTRNKTKFKNIKTLIITLGKYGCYILRESKITKVPALIPGIIDSTGSGDLFLSTFVYAFYNNLNLSESAILAHLSAGIHGTKFGNENKIDLEKLKAVADNIIK